MMSKKQIIKRMLLFAAIMGTLGASALISSCVPKESEEETKFTFDVEAEEAATYGTYYLMEEKIGVDADGHYYFPQVTITDSKGNNIRVENGKFFLSDIDGYTITYELEYEGKKITKTTAIKVSDKVAPEISLATNSELTPLGTLFEIPVYDVSDDYNKASDITVSVKVTHNDAEVEIVDNKIALNDEGDYLITYTATDTSGNSSSEIFTVSAVNEEDNVSFFNHSLCVNKLSLMNFLTETTVANDTETTFCGESTLKVNYRLKEKDGATVIFLDSPFITDISEYNYVYFYVYTDSDTAKISFNNNFVSDSYTMSAGGWQRVLLQKSGDTFTYAGGNAFYTAQDSQASLYPATMSDITKFAIQINTIDNSNANVWLSTIRVANDLPQAEIDFSNVSYCSPNEEIMLPQAVGTGYTNLIQKVYIKGENTDYVEIHGNTYTPTETGNYQIVYELYDGEKFVERISGKMIVEEHEEGVVAQFNKPSGEYIVKATSGIKHCTISTNAHLDNEESSLYVEFEGWPSISLTNPGIINLNEKDAEGNYLYNYLIFYAFTTNENTKLIYQAFGSDGEYYVSLQPYAWTPVIAYRKDATFVLPNGKDLFTENAPCTAENLTGLSVQFFGGYEGQASSVYISTIRASKDFPLLGAADNVVASALDVKAGNPYNGSLSTEKVYGDEKCSFKVNVGSVGDANWQMGAWGAITGGLTFVNPSIKDISGYKYLYFYVYTDTANLRVYANGSDKWSHQVNVTKGTWTLVCLERGEDGAWRYGNTNVVIGGDRATQETDITGLEAFDLYFAKDDNNGQTDVNSYGNIYISAIRVSNELPA